MKYEIVNTGSDGNCIIINDFLAIDMGVSYKSLKSYISEVKIVILTHIHGDHLKEITIKKLIKEKPNLRYATPFYLVNKLVELGVSKSKIDVLDYESECDYGTLKIKIEKLYHDVPNSCIKVEFNDGKKLFYATDTAKIDHIEAIGYDLYLIEANYKEQEMLARIEDKLLKQEYFL